MAPFSTRRRRTSLLPVAACLGGIALAQTAAPAGGADVEAKFVDALTQRGWNDTAVAYLDWAADKPTPGSYGGSG